MIIKYGTVQIDGYVWHFYAKGEYIMPHYLSTDKKE